MEPFRPDVGRVRVDQIRRFGPLAGLVQRYQSWNWGWRMEIALRYQPIIEALTERPPDQRILDVGCGSKGGVTAYLHRPAYGIDVTFDPIRVRAHPLLYPICGSGLALPFADASFDVVLCMDAIEHIPMAQRRPLITEMARVVRPYGLLAVGAPCGAPARAAEERLANEFQRRTGRPHPKLCEHLAYPAMTCDELRTWVAESAIERFVSARVRSVPNTSVRAWYFLQRLSDLGRPIPGFTHVHRLLMRPFYPWLATHLHAEPAYRQIIFVDAEQ